MSYGSCHCSGRASSGLEGDYQGSRSGSFCFSDRNRWFCQGCIKLPPLPRVTAISQALRLTYPRCPKSTPRRRCLFPPGVLRQQPLDDFAVDVGEAEIATLEAVGQLLVVEAEAMQHG